MSPSTNAAAIALHGRCWTAVRSHDLAALLELADDPTLTSQMLAVVAPGLDERDADPKLVHRVLDDPACTTGIASRYAVHNDPTIRLRIVEFVEITRATLLILASDPSQLVQAAAKARLREPGT